MSGKQKNENPREKKSKVFINRDFSWIQFNGRVQQEAECADNPLLERVKFLSIVSSNMDEFFAVRYHWISNFGNRKVLKWMGRINQALENQYLHQYVLYDLLSAALYRQNIQLYPYFTLNAAMRVYLKKWFLRYFAPKIKAEAFRAELVHHKQLYLCVKLSAGLHRSSRYMLVPMPEEVPCWLNVSTESGVISLIGAEEILKRYISLCFPRLRVECAAMFRILRNQDFPFEGETPDNVEETVRDMLQKRPDGRVLRLEADLGMNEDMLCFLLKNFRLKRNEVYRTGGPLDLNRSMAAVYHMVNRPELKYPPVLGKLIPELMEDDVFERIEQRDYLLYHPYHSYEIIQHLMERAAEDSTVTEIDQTLYRVSKDSRIVKSLLKAAENGKKVFVLFETHARFDEENNLYWAERLREAGCTVICGFPKVKVHAKITLIRRSCGGRDKSILHLGTGNYHDSTTRVYTDFGLLTADSVLTGDAVSFFNGFLGRPVEMQELMKSREGLKPKLIELIDREIQNAREGKEASIFAKMNALNDRKLMKKLEEASQSGVEVRLLVRGLCGMLPKVEGRTEHVRIRSIVGRNLEHARAFVFAGDGCPEVYLSSADWMTRNLDRRVELMFPIKDDRCRKAVMNILLLQWRDTVKCRRCRRDGSYMLQSAGKEGINAQEVLYRDIDAVMDGTCRELVQIVEKNSTARILGVLNEE